LGDSILHKKVALHEKKEKGRKNGRWRSGGHHLDHLLSGDGRRGCSASFKGRVQSRPPNSKRYGQNSAESREVQSRGLIGLSETTTTTTTKNGALHLKQKRGKYFRKMDAFERAQRVAVRAMRTRMWQKAIGEEDPMMVAHIPQLVRINKLGMITTQSQSGGREALQVRANGRAKDHGRARVLLRVRA
jgi:hypothetical protein